MRRKGGTASEGDIDATTQHLTADLMGLLT
jgi:hypothetical protein